MDIYKMQNRPKVLVVFRGFHRNLRFFDDIFRLIWRHMPTVVNIFAEAREEEHRFHAAFFLPLRYTHLDRQRSLRFHLFGIPDILLHVHVSGICASKFATFFVSERA